MLATTKFARVDLGSQPSGVARPAGYRVVAL